jgi:hypothetical protein
MGKKLFLLNIVYFIFDYFCIPYINPNGVVFGFVPFQMFLYWGMGFIGSALWGTYFFGSLNKQQRYDHLED